MDEIVTYLVRRYVDRTDSQNNLSDEFSLASVMKIKYRKSSTTTELKFY